MFPNPQPQRDYVIRFDVPEFTCLCPLTGQPDFAHFRIEIVSDRLCVELKSLKMYFWSLSRRRRIPREGDEYHRRRPRAGHPAALRAHQRRLVRARRHRHHVTAEHRKKGWKPQPRVDLPGATSAGDTWTRL